jgi:hypothetical protein
MHGSCLRAAASTMWARAATFAAALRGSGYTLRGGFWGDVGDTDD